MLVLGGVGYLFLVVGIALGWVGAWSGVFGFVDLHFGVLGWVWGWDLGVACCLFCFCGMVNGILSFPISGLIVSDDGDGP
jgi:hypothetical protein